MEPAASRVNTITSNAIVAVISGLMIMISGCAGLSTATTTAPEMKMTSDIPESIVMPDKIKTWIGTRKSLTVFSTKRRCRKPTIPKDVPANMFWSLTAYDNETRSLIQNDLGRPLVGSVHGAKANQDGSYDVYFGPELPESVPKENWVQTRPGMGWFAYIRLYGPEKAYFDKTWIPGDAEKVK